MQRVWRARASPRFGRGFQELRAESLYNLARLLAGIPGKCRYKKKDQNLNSLRRRQCFQSSCQGLLPGRVGQNRHSAARIPGGDRAGSCWGGSPTRVPTPHALHPMELPGVTLAVGADGRGAEGVQADCEGRARFYTPSPARCAGPVKATPNSHADVFLLEGEDGNWKATTPQLTASHPNSYTFVFRKQNLQALTQHLRCEACTSAIPFQLNPPATAQHQEPAREEDGGEQKDSQLTETWP